jgi:hypothetical protein
MQEIKALFATMLQDPNWDMSAGAPPLSTRAACRSYREGVYIYPPDVGRSYKEG